MIGSLSNVKHWPCNKYRQTDGTPSAGRYLASAGRYLPKCSAKDDVDALSSQVGESDESHCRTWGVAWALLSQVFSLSDRWKEV